MNVRIKSTFVHKPWTGDVPESYINGHFTEELPDVFFRLFNRVDTEDVHRLRDWGYDLPSLSVGDTITFRPNWHSRKQTWQVEPVGWKQVKRSWL